MFLATALAWDMIAEIGEAHLARRLEILPILAEPTDLAALQPCPQLCWQTPENQQRVVRAPDDSPDWQDEWEDDYLGEGNSWLEIWQHMARADNGSVDAAGQVHRPPSPLQWSGEARWRGSQAAAAAGGGELDEAPLSEPLRCAVWLLFGRNWIGNLNWSRDGS